MISTLEQKNPSSSLIYETHFPMQSCIQVYLPSLQTIPYGAVQLEKGESHSFIRQS